ncbi:aldehyde ferredoxin oxidoreductase N-terminal domain-containing protein [Escherichia coli]
MKFAGYDVIIIEGKAKSPVWRRRLKIKSQPGKLISMGKRDARTDGRNLSIDQSGNLCGGYWSGWENLVPLSGMLNSRNHSGGAGTGAIMGSKNLKAIAVRGTERGQHSPLSGDEASKRLHDDLN